MSVDKLERAHGRFSLAVDNAVEHGATFEEIGEWLCLSESYHKRYQAEKAKLKELQERLKRTNQVKAR